MFAKAIETNFQRIQFTPDMLPADLLGTLIFNQKLEKFETRKVQFSNIILADEINRAPSKVQSALLECSRKTSNNKRGHFYSGISIHCDCDPKSIRAGGTYPLPEAQLTDL